MWVNYSRVCSFLWTSPTIAFLIENPILRFDTPSWNLCWISICKLSQTKLRDALPTLPTEPHSLPTNTHCGLAQACRMYSKFFTKGDQFQWMLIRLYLRCPMWISVSSPHCIDFVCNHMMQMSFTFVVKAQWACNKLPSSTSYRWLPPNPLRVTWFIFHIFGRPYLMNPCIILNITNSILKIISYYENCHQPS